MVTKTQIVTGRVLAVQEERLHITTDSGQTLLLTLGRFARLPDSLASLERSQAGIKVTYTGEANLVSGVISQIELI